MRSILRSKDDPRMTERERSKKGVLVVVLIIIVLLVNVVALWLFLLGTLDEACAILRVGHVRPTRTKSLRLCVHVLPVLVEQPLSQTQRAARPAGTTLGTDRDSWS